MEESQKVPPSPKRSSRSNPVSINPSLLTIYFRVKSRPGSTSKRGTKSQRPTINEMEGSEDESRIMAVKPITTLGRRESGQRSPNNVSGFTLDSRSPTPRKKSSKHRRGSQASLPRPEDDFSFIGRKSRASAASDAERHIKFADPNRNEVLAHNHISFEYSDIKPQRDTSDAPSGGIVTLSSRS